MFANTGNRNMIPRSSNPQPSRHTDYTTPTPAQKINSKTTYTPVPQGP